MSQESSSETKFASEVELAVQLLHGKTLAVLTGAGISTDSGIPDYRSPGAPARTPMTIQQFLSTEESYRRYWAGSYLGWSKMQAFLPNAGHQALTRLQEHGIVASILTQNVDSLHERAGSSEVIHLHGSMERVRCLNEGHVFLRSEVEHWLEQDNALTVLQAGRLRPDGDVDVAVPEAFRAPFCPICGGRLKPDVIYFGEVMLPEVNAAAVQAIDDGEALLVAGSSLAVNSGHRMVVRAQRAGKPVVIVNRGETKGDRIASLKLEYGTSETLRALAQQLL